MICDKNERPERTCMISMSFWVSTGGTEGEGRQSLESVTRCLEVDWLQS